MTKYIGEELENFTIATFWRKYVLSKVWSYYQDKKVVEIGSGVGSFSKIISRKCKSLTLVEPDSEFCDSLEEKFKNNKKIVKIINGTSDDVREKFDTIVHFQVLEHIKNDNKEIINNLNLLNENGHLLICVPSFMSLYSSFDKMIGHFKRYEKKDFLDFKLGNSKIIKMFYVDSCGYLAYSFFKLFINSSNPKKFMIFIWDKFFIPISFFLDFFLRYKIGKNLIVIIQKKSF